MLYHNMIKELVFLCLFSIGFVYTLYDAIKKWNRIDDANYRVMYRENKLLWMLIFFYLISNCLSKL